VLWDYTAGKTQLSPRDILQLVSPVLRARDLFGGSNSYNHDSDHNHNYDDNHDSDHNHYSDDNHDSDDNHNYDDNQETDSDNARKKDTALHKQFRHLPGPFQLPQVLPL
jgi:hypothetical protein